MNTSSRAASGRADPAARTVRPWTPPVFAARAAPAAPVPDPQVLERLEDAARQRGYADGVQRGAADIAARIAAVDALVAALAAPLSGQAEALANAIRQTAWTLGELLARDHLRHRPEAVVHLAQEAVAALAAPDQPLAIRVSAAQYDAIQAALEQHPPRQAWHLESDPALANGDCKVTTPHATADATFDTRLRLLAEQLLDASVDPDLDTRPD